MPLKNWDNQTDEQIKLTGKQMKLTDEKLDYLEDLVGNISHNQGDVAEEFFYPDVMVVCDDDEASEYFTESPTLLVEVLSRSTRRMDETVKKIAYQNIPTLQEYVLIEQDVVDVEVCKRSEGWVSKHYFMGDELTIESLNLTLSIEGVYRRVNNEDVSAFYKEQL